MKDKLKDIELLIQSGESKKVKAYNLDSILKNVSSDNVDIAEAHPTQGEGHPRQERTVSRSLRAFLEKGTPYSHATTMLVRDLPSCMQFPKQTAKDQPRQKDEPNK